MRLYNLILLDGEYSNNFVRIAFTSALFKDVNASESKKGGNKEGSEKDGSTKRQQAIGQTAILYRVESFRVRESMYCELDVMMTVKQSKDTNHLAADDFTYEFTF